MNTGRPEAGAHYADLYNEAQIEIANLKLQREPRTVRDVIGFAYIEAMSARQIHELLTKLHERNQELQAIVNMTAEAFDGGPEHPWIPGFDAQKIYAKVMKAYAPALPSGQCGDPSP